MKRLIPYVTLAIVVGLSVLSSLPASSTSALSPSPQSDPVSIALTPVFTGLNHPVFVTHAGDGTNRLFVVERRGVIWVAIGGVLQGTPFLDIQAAVWERDSGEQGLLGLAFHPDFETNGSFYVFYTSNSTNTFEGQRFNTLARYQVSSSDPNRGDAGSGQVLLSIPDPFGNHNGGMLAFGADRYLYVGTGDGGSGGDPQNHGQNLLSLLGKMLRLDVDSSFPYAIPQSNPFRNNPNARGEIWALGLRNPWRWSFDRLTQDMYIGDVGQGSYEEISRQPGNSAGGENYGWRIMEGFHCYPSDPCSSAGLTLPIAEYAHAGGNCSVTGGYVYRGPSLAALTGAYIFGDYCSGRIWSLRQNGSGMWIPTELLDTSLNISSFGEDEAGEHYLTDLRDSAVYRIVQAGASPTPTRTITVGPSSTPTITRTATATPSRMPTPSRTATPTGTATPSRTPTPSRTATPTPSRTASPTPPPTSTALSCDPRPNMVVTATRGGGGTLIVTVSAGTSVALPINTLHSLRFGTSTNARVTAGGQTSNNGNFILAPALAVQQFTFTVERLVAGAATTVPYTVVDECGPWDSFVGGGESAGF
jgi:glucose/arabinose dehydrogenase